MGRLNKQDCQNVMIMNFITLDLDANAANVLITNANGGPGQARVTPIDAGRKLPTPETFKRAPNSMSLVGTPGDGKFTDNDVFLLQSPAAREPFSNDIIAKIKQLDANQVVQQMRATYDGLKQQAPELDNTVSDGSLDMVRKSIRFLKQAVEQDPPLTPYDISEIYAKAFAPVVDAQSPQEEDQAIQNAVRDLQAIKANGGNDAITQRFPPYAVNPNSMTLREKARILAGQPPINTKEDFEKYQYGEFQTSLHDIQTYITDGPERITDELTRPYSKDNYKYLKLLDEYKREGGDQMLKSLIDCDPTYQVEVAKPVADRNNWTVIGYAKTYYAKGGTPALIKLVGQKTFDDDFRGKGISVLKEGLEKAQKEA